MAKSRKTGKKLPEKQKKQRNITVLGFDFVAWAPAMTTSLYHKGSCKADKISRSAQTGHKRVSLTRKSRNYAGR